MSKKSYVNLKGRVIIEAEDNKLVFRLDDGKHTYYLLESPKYTSVVEHFKNGRRIDEVMRFKNWYNERLALLNRNLQKQLRYVQDYVIPYAA